MDSLTLTIGGSDRHLDAAVLFAQMAKALRGQELSTGDHTIEMDREGSVWLNGEQVYTPSRPNIAQKGN